MVRWIITFDGELLEDYPCVGDAPVCYFDHPVSFLFQSESHAGFFANEMGLENYMIEKLEI